MIDVLEYLKQGFSNSSLVLEGEPEVSTEEVAKAPVEVPTDDPEKTGDPKLVYENSIDMVIVDLHKIAVENAGNEFDIVNSAFDDPKNPTKLVSTGEHVITVLPKDKSKGIEKDAAMTVLKTYVQWFIGPDASKKITDKVVYPIVNDENTPSEDKVSGEAMQPLMSFSQFLIEGEPASKGDEEKDDSISNDENDPEFAKKLQQNDSSEETDKALESNNGFYTIYQLDSIPGKKDTTLADVTKKFAKSVFRNIAGFNWMTGAAGKTVGEIADDIDNVFGNIKPDELVSNVKTELGKKMPGYSPEVSVYDSKTILKHCTKILDKKDKLKIQPVKFSLTIRLRDNDTGVDKTRNEIIKKNLKIIADAVNKAIAGFVKRVKFHIKPEHIIATKDSDSRDKVEIEYEKQTIDRMLKKIKNAKNGEAELQKWDEDTYKGAIAAKKENSLKDLQYISTRLKKFISVNKDKLGIKESISDEIMKQILAEDDTTSSESSDLENKDEVKAGEKEAESTAISKEDVQKKAEEIVKKTFSDQQSKVEVMPSSDATTNIISKEYGSNEKIDEKFDNVIVVEIKDLDEDSAKKVTKDKLQTPIESMFKELGVNEFGEVIEIQKNTEEKTSEKLNSSQVRTFDGIFNMLFEAKDDENISKDKIEEIQKEFGKIAKSSLPKHDVETKVEEGKTIIDELKEKKVGNNELYGKLKDAKYIFSICAKAKDALKESFESFAFNLLDLLLEGGKTKSPREVFIGKIAHALSLKKDFLDANKDKIQKLDIDDNIKKYLVDGYKGDVKDGKLDKNTKYFEKIKIPQRDKAFKDATSKLDEIINSTDEKKAENAEIEKKEEEKKTEEKAAKDEQKPELTKFKDKLEAILKKNPKFFEKYKDELDKSEINKKIKTYLKDNLKDDYDGEHLKNTAFLKKNISDEEFKDSIEKIGKFYDEYSNSEEGKKEKEEIDNSKEDAKFSLSNNLEEKEAKAIFDEILKKFPDNIRTDTDEFYIANGEVDEKKDITKINSEWSTTYKHDQQKQDTKDNGSIQKEEVKGESIRASIAKIICEDLIDEMTILEGSEFHKGQLSKDKVGYKTKIEAGLKRINEVIPGTKFSKILDQALRQYKDQFSRNYDKHVKSGNLKAALLDPKKFTDKMYNDFTRGELFAITVILRVILYSYYFTEVGSYALMPADLVSESTKNEVKIASIQKALIAPFKLEEKKTEEKPEEKTPGPEEKTGDDEKQEKKEKYNFFIIPMKGLDYKDSDDERMQNQK